MPARKFTLADLRAARASGAKVPMLTCYDYSTAVLMEKAGVPILLVGDSAANVVLGHPSTLPIPLGFMIELTAAVRRGAPNALLMGDMPFGSYSADLRPSLRNVTRMMKLSGCDCVKLEVAASHLDLIRQLTDIGVATVAHLGLRPQSVMVAGGYKFQGRTTDEANAIVDLAISFEQAGATAILLEAVPPEVSAKVVAKTKIPIIGCGAGPACHASVVVYTDALGFSAKPPRFVPQLNDVAGLIVQSATRYVQQVQSGEYPAAQHQYEMPADERTKFNKQ